MNRRAALYRELAAVEGGLLDAVAERRQRLIAARRRILDALEEARRRRNRTRPAPTGAQACAQQEVSTHVRV
jgi:hypothetical protein